ncbi:MAG: SBBP repeat-containing protein [Chitinophagales bacterium]
MKTLPIIFFLTLTISVSAQQPAATYNRDPKVFIENQGQIVDQHGQRNKDVSFLYHDGLFNLALKESGFSYEIFEVRQELNGLYESGRRSDENPEGGVKRITSHRVDVTFEGASRNVIPIASNAIAGYFNYIHAPVESNRQLHVQGYNKITYPDLYSGIDLVFYTPGGRMAGEYTAGALRYEFIVHPGADLAKIKFRYEGATDFLINESGSFLINTSCGFIQETKPEYFIEGSAESVSAEFIIHKNIRSFSSCSYDDSKFLIIDPNMIWGTYYGGEKADEVAEVSVGSDGSPVLNGQTISFNHIATSGAYQQGFAGGINDWFITKFNTDGSLDWSTYFGGNDKDYCYGLAIDDNNNIITAGNSESQGLATPGAYQDSIVSASSDVLITKFSPEGNLVWSTYFGGEGSEEVRNLVTDHNGDIYLGGTTRSDSSIASPGAYQDSLMGFDDALIMKFSASGGRVWSTYYGDSGVDRIHAVSLDLEGHLYVAGTTSSKKGIASPGSHQAGYGGGSEDAMVLKFDTSGAFVWGTYYGGDEDDRSRGIETDSAGNVYLGGFTNSKDSIATPGAYQDQLYPGNQGGSPTEDAYLAKFNSEGVRQWGTYLGGAHTENLWGMTVDKTTEALYIAGSTNSFENIAYGNAIQPVKAGGDDCLFAKFYSDGLPEWSTYFGGLIGDQFEDVAVDKNHFLYLVARATGIDMPTTPDAYQKIFYGGVSDAMMYKFYGGNDCFDQFEPNESLADAKAVLTYHNNYSDTTVYGYNAVIRNAADQDWYAFSIADSELNMMAIISLYSVDLNLNLYNDQGILIYQSSNPDSMPDTISVNGLTAGAYYLEVPHAPAEFDSLHCYRLQIFVSDSLFPVIGIPTPVSAASSSQNFLIFPNPVHDQLSFFIPLLNNETATLIIRDMLNRIVYSDEIKVAADGRQISIPAGNFSSGPYSIIIRSTRSVWEGKFTKQ